jgi:hypothetical protein
MTDDLDPDHVSALVEGELGRFSIAGTREAFATVRCSPYPQDRVWDWNRRETVKVWVLGHVEASDTVLVYSPDGYRGWG